MSPLFLSLLIILSITSLVSLGCLWWLLGRQGKHTIESYLEKEKLFRHQEQESLRKAFRDAHFHSTEVIQGLQKELGKMGQVALKIEHLDQLFRSPKARGNLGEESLEEILKNVFPRSMWERQFSLGSLIVDAIIKTKNGLIPIDAKFPLPAFEAMITHDQEDERKKAEKQFHQDVKKRINEVAQYIDPARGTLSFAILFLPNESLYYEACVRVDHLQTYARDKQVLLTGPNTLLYLLQMIFKAYQSQTFAEKAQEALAQLSSIQKQSKTLDSSLETLEKHLTHAYHKISDIRSQSTTLQNKIEKVQQLREKQET